ncbi:MAG: glycosyltransferase [Bdellovibrionaceae bacterium]|nr:glycosyltransferase [Pseudobdellovibrionaceae bacterium]
MASVKFNVRETSLTIGIVLYNEEKHKDQIYSNIKALSAFHQVRVIVVNNASTDTTLSYLTQLKKQFDCKIINRTSNHLARARQDVMTLAQTEWVGFIDGDCRITEQWVSSALKKIESLPQAVAAIGGGWIPAGRWSSLYQDFFASYLGHFSLPQLHLSQDMAVEHIPTANIIYNKRAVVSVGGFREEFNRVGEDLDLSYRLRRERYILQMSGDLKIQHYLPSSFCQWSQKIFIYGYGRAHVASQNHDLLNRILIIPLGFLFCFLLSPIFFHQWLWVFYAAAVLVFGIINARRSPFWQLACLLVITQFSYALGMFFYFLRSMFPPFDRNKQFVLRKERPVEVGQTSLL